MNVEKEVVRLIKLVDRDNKGFSVVELVFALLFLGLLIGVITFAYSANKKYKTPKPSPTPVLTPTQTPEITDTPTPTLTSTPLLTTIPTPTVTVVQPSTPILTSTPTPSIVATEKEIEITTATEQISFVAIYSKIPSDHWDDVVFYLISPDGVKLEDTSDDRSVVHEKSKTYQVFRVYQPIRLNGHWRMVALAPEGDPIDMSYIDY